MDGAEQLMMAALDDELSADGRDQLGAALARDAALSGRWIALVRQERQLRHWGRQDDGAEVARRVLAELARERAAAGRIMAEVRMGAPARDPRQRLARRAALAAGLVLAAGLGWLAVRPQPTSIDNVVPGSSAGRFFVVSGAVELADRGAPAGSGAVLGPGDRLTIGGSGSAVLSADRGATRLTLAAGSSLRLLGGGGGMELALDAGTMAATVAPQAPDRPLRIATPHAELRVVGTRFTLAVAGTTTLSVEEGVVAVRRPGQRSEIMVGAGAAFDSADQGQLPVMPVVWMRSAQWERIATAGSVLPSGVASQAAAPSRDPHFRPDQLICLQSGAGGSGAPGDRLFLVPSEMTLDLHLRSERAGTVMVVLAPFQAMPTDAIHAGSQAIAVGPSWTTISISAAALGSHAFPHGLPVGTKVWAISIFGFAAGRIELDHIVVRGGPAAQP